MCSLRRRRRSDNWIVFGGLKRSYFILGYFGEKDWRDIWANS